MSKTDRRQIIVDGDVTLCHNWAMKKKEPIYRDGLLLWHCHHCGQDLPPDRFYKSKKNTNGLSAHCRTCHCAVAYATANRENKRMWTRRRMRLLRQSDPVKWKLIDSAQSRRYQLLHPRGPAHIAYAIVRKAIRNGSLVRPSCCTKCGRKGIIHAHHEDYNKPLDVAWLCYECHGDQTAFHNQRSSV